MNGLIEQAASEREFIMGVAARQEIHWQWRSGIDFVYRKENIGWALSMSVAPKMQHPQMYVDLLGRRFEYAEVYEGYYIWLDVHRTLVVWRALDDGRQWSKVEAAIQVLLSLLDRTAYTSGRLR